MKDKLGNISNSRLRGLFARAILDENIHIEVKGLGPRPVALRAILEASRHLFHTLQNSDVSLEEVKEALRRKHDAAQRYHKLFNDNWYF